MASCVFDKLGCAASENVCGTLVYSKYNFILHRYICLRLVTFLQNHRTNYSYYDAVKLVQFNHYCTDMHRV
jgi:hypothetical protein